ncbi:hypothetical protein HII31_00169 [Pseudocercospora fuligena]|uniref:Histone deacetylase complex subunit SAP30 Sin3 binding domain-containing protein n=1 Tax=Pseudocercospora fuligena TaxID=685502 RepID=A0A8H6VNK6_9PEZI|nr:hypothetical protein HII31_00169 [Pseudocercospora fuligena]
MPPAKSSDARADAQTIRERQIAAAAHARNAKKNNGTAQQNGISSLREVVKITNDDNALAIPKQETGVMKPATPIMSPILLTQPVQMAWQSAPLSLLNQYRVSHNIQTPPAFSSPYRQAILTNPGIGRQSPTMARKKERRRISKENLALAVRKNFNGAAVNEIDVVVELVYKVRNKDKAFRMRSTPNVPKKA